MTKQLNTEELKTEIIKATEISFCHLQSLIKNECLYAFCLWLDEEGTKVRVYANTEENLHRQVSKYNQQTGESRENLLISLRWYCQGDWAYNGFGEGSFEAVSNILDEGWTMDYSQYLYDYNSIFNACVESLLFLEQKGLFAENGNVLINVLNRLQSLPDIIHTASLLNNLQVFEKFVSEINQANSLYL